MNLSWFSVVRLLTAGFLAILVGACAGNGEGDLVCEPNCQGSQTCCPITGCTYTQSDVNNCGMCGVSCLTGQSCVNGACVGSVVTSDAGTGGGGTVVDSGSTGGGGGGECNPECSVNQRCCGGTCVNRQVDPNTDGRIDTSFANCNGCGFACDDTRASACSVPGGGAGMPQCMCGNFFECGTGELCVPEGAGFGCVNVQTDPNNCGSPGNACADGESCLDGVCVCGSGASATTCGSGQSCCGGSCIDTTADATNCGGCGVACGPNGPDCVAGVCSCGTAAACTAPTPAMGGGLPIPIPGMGGGDLGEVCCAGACLPQDNNNCGGCGVMCEGSEECQQGGLLSSILPGGGMGDAIEICCLEPGIGALLGCGGAGGGLPFPIPGTP